MNTKSRTAQIVKKCPYCEYVTRHYLIPEKYQLRYRVELRYCSDCRRTIEYHLNSRRQIGE